jgi:hypothetical protein
MARLSFPSDYGTRGCALVAVDLSLLPIIAGLIKPLEQERLWVTEDYEAAYRAITALEACMTALCVQDLVESNNRLYRLIDAGLFGRAYDAGAEPPGTITPIIPDVPDLSFADPGLLGKVEYLSQAFQSFVGGIDTANFIGTPNVLGLLQAIIDALAAEDTDLGDLLSQLELIAALLG